MKESAQESEAKGHMKCVAVKWKCDLKVQSPRGLLKIVINVDVNIQFIEWHKKH